MTLNEKMKLIDELSFARKVGDTKKVKELQKILNYTDEQLEWLDRGLTGYASIDKPQNKGYGFFDTHPIIPYMSVYNSIQAINMFYKEKTAIDCLDLTASYGQMIKDAVTISKSLKELGVKRGQIVSICVPNFYQGVISYLACNRIGAGATFINYGAPDDEIIEYLNEFESPVLINYNRSDEDNNRFKRESKVDYVVSLNKENINNLDLNGDYHKTTKSSIIDFNSLGSIANYQKKGIPTNNPKDISLILFTSGSTGKPKSVVLTNENILAAGTYLKNSSKVKSLEGDRTLVCVPFTYPYGFVTSTIMTLLSSKTAILGPDISKDTIPYYLGKEPNIIFGSPALLELIMRNTPENQSTASVKEFISGGDFLTPSLASTGKKFFHDHGANNVRMGNGSGNAETVSCGTNPTGVKEKPETAGRVLVGTDVIIVDENTLEEKKYGEEGLELVSGKHVFKEYFNDPERTKEAKVVIDGKEYFKTGTMGYLDEEGYFTLTGRQSRFYIISTLNKVYCDHVQSIISNIPSVKECAVVPVPDAEMLFTNKVYIVLNEGVEKTQEIEQSIKEAFNNPVKTFSGDIEQLKWYEIPETIEIVDELPRRKGTDKINYTELAKDAKEKKEKILKLQK